MISNRKRWWVMSWMVMTAICTLQAQDIRVAKFERNYTSLIASMNPVYDNTGTACAVIRCFVRDTTFMLEPNLGVVRRETMPGEIRLWVPQGTKRMTVRGAGLLPLSNYVIPERVETKATYEMVIEVELKPNDHVQKQRKGKANVHPYIGAGYHFLGVTGPNMLLGVRIGQEQIELSGVYGLNKSKTMYFSSSDYTLLAAWKYRAMRAGLRYGHLFNIGDYFGVVPMIGVGGQMIRGESTDESTGQSDYQNASSVSASIGLRAQLSFGKLIRLQVSPEWNFGLYKSKNCKLISAENKTIKSWTEGPCVNVGLIVEL